MNLKELIKGIEKDLYIIKNSMDMKEVKLAEERIYARKQTVEAVDVVIMYANYYNDYKYRKDWQKLKKLLEVK